MKGPGVVPSMATLHQVTWLNPPSLCWSGVFGCCPTWQRHGGVFGPLQADCRGCQQQVVAPGGRCTATPVLCWAPPTSNVAMREEVVLGGDWQLGRCGARWRGLEQSPVRPPSTRRRGSIPHLSTVLPGRGMAGYSGHSRLTAGVASNRWLRLAVDAPPPLSSAGPHQCPTLPLF